MQNEKALRKQMDERRNYNFRNEMESGGGGHPESVLLASNFCLSTGTYLVSNPEPIFKATSIGQNF